MPHTLEEYEEKFRRQWLGFMAECWGCRHFNASEYGRLVDKQLREMNRIMTLEYTYLTTEPKPPAQPAPTKGPSK